MDICTLKKKKKTKYPTIYPYCCRSDFFSADLISSHAPIFSRHGIFFLCESQHSHRPHPHGIFPSRRAYPASSARVAEKPGRLHLPQPSGLPLLPAELSLSLVFFLCWRRPWLLQLGLRPCVPGPFAPP